MNETIECLVKPKMIWLFSVRIQIVNIASMRNIAFAA